MKMRKFADEGFVREGKNENIDADVRARAMASVEGLDKPKPSAGAVAVPGRGGPVAAGTLTKKTPTVTKEELEKSGLSLRDYMNKQQGLTRRQDKVNPDMGAKADKAFLDFVKDRNQPAAAPAAPADIPAARSEVKNTPNDLRAKSKEQQARGAKLRGQTPGVLGENAAKLEKEFKNSLNVKDFLESSSYAKGGAVSASRRGDGIAQRGKTRGRMC